MTQTAQLPTDFQIDREKILYCLTLTDEQLLQLSVRDLERYLLFSPWNILFRNRRPSTVAWIIKGWRALKQRAQKKAGALLVLPLKNNGNDHICEELDYCRRKAEIYELTKSYLENHELAWIAEEYSETIEWLAEVIKEIVDVIGDAALPISFILLSIKYGFDDLCNCCESCGGTGLQEDDLPCSDCDGRGVAANT